jgi:hypothetical protein
VIVGQGRALSYMPPLLYDAVRAAVPMPEPTSSPLPFRATIANFRRKDLHARL